MNYPLVPINLMKKLKNKKDKNVYKQKSRPFIGRLLIL